MVIPILNSKMAQGLVNLGAALAGARLEGEHRHIRIVVLGVVTVPEETPLSQGASLVKAYRTMLRYLPQNDLDEWVEVQTEVRVAREVWQGIADQVAEEKGDLLLLHWKGSTQTPGRVYGDTIDALLADPPCDMVLARFNTHLPEIKNILLPVRGGSYSTLALHLASNLAEDWGASVTVLHGVNRTGPLSQPKGLFGRDRDYYGPAFPEVVEDEPLASLQNLLSELPPGARLVTLQNQSPLAGIVREAHYHDLIILGSSEVGLREGRERDRKGETSEPETMQTMAGRIAAETDRPLLVVKTRKPFELNRPASATRGASATRQPALDELVDRWFAENTFHYREFRSMSSLTLLKERNNLTISLILPVYGKTGPVALAEQVRRARFALMRDCALVDEIVVCVPDGRLDEAEIKRLYSSIGSAQERPLEDEVVYCAPDGAVPGAVENSDGPGEALWHALQRARGNLVVWADPTLEGFDARLIYGLLGPLLSYPEFQLATGFYSDTEGSKESSAEHSQPVRDDTVELSLRPLLGGFFPQLAGVINPLCSVGAARRDLLIRMPLFTGPAFLTALLVDTQVRSGLMSIAQVDLGSQPSSQETISPQHITSEVLAVLLRRAEERNQSHWLAHFNSSVKTIHKAGGVYSLKVAPVVAPQRELPPALYSPNFKNLSFDTEE